MGPRVGLELADIWLVVRRVPWLVIQLRSMHVMFDFLSLFCFEGPWDLSACLTCSVPVFFDVIGDDTFWIAPRSDIVDGALAPVFTDSSLGYRSKINEVLITTNHQVTDPALFCIDRLESL